MVVFAFRRLRYIGPHSAAWGGKVEALEWLIAHKADFNEQDNYGKNAFDVATDPAVKEFLQKAMALQNAIMQAHRLAQKVLAQEKEIKKLEAELDAERKAKSSTAEKATKSDEDLEGEMKTKIKAEEATELTKGLITKEEAEAKAQTISKTESYDLCSVSASEEYCANFETKAVYKIEVAGEDVEV